ncbi:hypothetical protein HYS85_01040 [Candidatus Saccharibacteria bacterium]|nr:hypothetical protein [Candidatus Saccharibacteria bacterium]
MARASSSNTRMKILTFMARPHSHKTREHCYANQPVYILLLAIATRTVRFVQSIPILAFASEKRSGAFLTRFWAMLLPPSQYEKGVIP